MLAAEDLKNVLRYSEIKNLGRHESSADHSWKVALSALALTKESDKFDFQKIIKIALIHDLPEIHTGNTDYVLVAGKKDNDLASQQNKEAPWQLNNEYSGLLAEYQAQTSPEARYVNAISKIESLVYLLKLGYQYFDRPDLIPNYADEAVSEFPTLKPYLKMVKSKLKSEYTKGKLGWREEYDCD